MKKKENDFFNDWSNAIKNTKFRINYYYRKDDIKREHPYRVSGVCKHYKTGKTFIHFYPSGTEDLNDYILEDDEFLSQFIRVEKEV